MIHDTQIAQISQKQDRRNIDSEIAIYFSDLNEAALVRCSAVQLIAFMLAKLVQITI